MAVDPKALSTSVAAVRSLDIGKPAAIRMDNGPETTAAKFVSWAEQQGIALRYV